MELFTWSTEGGQTTRRRSSYGQRRDRTAREASRAARAGEGGGRGGTREQNHNKSDITRPCAGTNSLCTVGSLCRRSHGGKAVRECSIVVSRWETLASLCVWQMETKMKNPSGFVLFFYVERGLRLTKRIKPHAQSCAWLIDPAPFSRQVKPLWKKSSFLLKTAFHSFPPRHPWLSLCSSHTWARKKGYRNIIRI